MKLKLPRIPRPHWPRRTGRPGVPEVPPPAPGSVLRVFRGAALAAIAAVITAASAASFAESYRGLLDWAHHHGLSGFWAAAFPLQLDSFIVVGELSLFVAMTDRWSKRDRIGAWLVALLGLAASTAGNVGHVAAHDLQSRGTAAVPPLAAFAALWVALGVLKRVVSQRHPAPGICEPLTDLPTQIGNGVADLVPVADAVPSPVPVDAEHAALLALRATHAAGNPLSLNQLQSRFSLTRAQATRTRQLVLAESNGHQADDDAGTLIPA